MHGCVWPFVKGQSQWAQTWPTAHRLFARSVCDEKLRCSCSCRLWRYTALSVVTFYIYYTDDNGIFVGKQLPRYLKVR